MQMAGLKVAEKGFEWVQEMWMVGLMDAMTDWEQKMWMVRMKDALIGQEQMIAMVEEKGWGWKKKQFD